MNIRIYVLLVLSILLLSQAAEAKDEGLYIGASIGMATVQQNGSDPELGAFEIDDSDVAYKLYGGYQFSPLFALEGGYRDLGEPSSQQARTHINGYDLAGVAGIPVGPVRVFGKLGAIYLDSSTRISGKPSTAGDDGFDLLAGAGLEFELGSLAVRGEVEYLDILDHTWVYTVGMTITF